MIDMRKPLTTKQKFKIGATIGLGVFIVVLEKRRVDGIIAMSQAAVQATMWDSFDAGFDRGVELCKEFLVAHPKELKELANLAQESSQYAFNAFDKTA